MRRLVTLGATVAFGAGLATGCGGGSSDTEVRSGPARSTTTTTTTTTAPPPATVQVAESFLGPILVDGAGLTLYAFANDTPTSVSCTGDCAGLWPPVTVAGPGAASGLVMGGADTPVAGPGVDPALLGSLDGPNGKQVTYAGHPLYRYSLDQAPGETKGQGVGGTWWVLAADGAIVMPTVVSTSPPRSPQTSPPATAAPQTAPPETAPPAPPPPPPPPPTYPYPY